MNTMQKGTEAHKLEAKLIAMALSNGYNIGNSLSTKDGDFVRIIAVDVVDHAFPFVGEIIDSEMITSQRLARFSISGLINAKTPDAQAKHSLKKNTKSEVDTMIDSIMGSSSLGSFLRAIGLDELTPVFAGPEFNVYSLQPTAVHVGAEVGADKAEVKAAPFTRPADAQPDRTVAAPGPGELRVEFMKLRNEFDALQDHVVKSVGTRLMELRDDVDMDSRALEAHTAQLNTLRHDINNLDLRVVRR